MDFGLVEKHHACPWAQKFEFIQRWLWILNVASQIALLVGFVRLSSSGWCRSRYAFGQMPDFPGDKMPFGSTESYNKLIISKSAPIFMIVITSGWHWTLFQLYLEGLDESSVGVIVKIIGFLHHIWPLLSVFIPRSVTEECRVKKRG